MDLPDPEIELGSPALQVDSLPTELTKSNGDIAFQDVYYKNKITSVGKDVEKWNLCTLLVEMKNGVAIMEV